MSTNCCSDCLSGNHDQPLNSVLDCDCPCHKSIFELKGKREEIDENNKNDKSNENFPSLTTEQIENLLISLSKMNPLVETPLTNFLKEISNNSVQSGQFQKHIMDWKNILHFHNRTTGLTLAYTLGVLVGVLAVKPELLKKL